MIYILDNGNNFPKLCKTILKWIDKEFKEVVDLEFEYETGDILVMNGEKFTKDYHDGNFIKKVLKDIHIPVVVLIDDSASNWGGTRVELNHNNPVYILSPDVVKSIPKIWPRKLGRGKPRINKSTARSIVRFFPFKTTTPRSFSQMFGLMG